MRTGESLFCLVQDVFTPEQEQMFPKEVEGWVRSHDRRNKGHGGIIHWGTEPFPGQGLGLGRPVEGPIREKTWYFSVPS